MRLPLFLAAASFLTAQFPIADPPLVPPALRARWAEDMHTKNLDDIMSLYAPGAVFASPDVGAISTPADLRKLYETVFTTYDSTITLNTPQHHDTGEPHHPTSIIDEGTYTEALRNRSTGTTQTLCGAYTFTYIKAPNDAPGWRISRMEWTTTLCPATDTRSPKL